MFKSPKVLFSRLAFLFIGCQLPISLMAEAYLDQDVWLDRINADLPQAAAWFGTTSSNSEDSPRVEDGNLLTELNHGANPLVTYFSENSSVQHSLDEVGDAIELRYRFSFSGSATIVRINLAGADPEQDRLSSDFGGLSHQAFEGKRGYQLNILADQSLIFRKTDSGANIHTHKTSRFGPIASASESLSPETVYEGVFRLTREAEDRIGLYARVVEPGAGPNGSDLIINEHQSSTTDVQEGGSFDLITDFDLLSFSVWKSPGETFTLHSVEVVPLSPEPVAIDFDNHEQSGATVSIVDEPDGSKTAVIDAEGLAPHQAFWRWPISEGFKEGEVVWIRITGSVTDPIDALWNIPTLFALSSSPFTRYADGLSAFDSTEREQIVIGTITEDLDPGDARIVLQLGGFSGSLNISDIEMVRYPPGTAIASLPQSPIVWQGRAEDAAWRDDAAAAIQQNRTTEMRVRVLDSVGNPVPNATVNISQQGHNFAFGTAVSSNLLLNENHPQHLTYREKLLENFEYGTPENSLKWEALDFNSWEEGKSLAEFGEAAVDELLALGLRVRGHTLLWPSYDESPAYLDGLDDADLLVEIENRVRSASATFAGKVEEWDAINEVFSNDDFVVKFGESLLEDVFNWAREEDPDARLFINDFNILMEAQLHTPRKDDYYNRIQALLDADAPIGGIGMQGHFNANQMPGVDDLKATLDRFAELGLPIQITEFDHEITDEDAQADYLRDVLTLAFAHPSVDGFIVWGFYDAAHWKGNAPFYRADWSEKPALQVWRDLVYGEWWTDELEVSTDEDGWATFPGAFFGTYAVEVEGAEPVEFQLQTEATELEVEKDPLLSWLATYDYTQADLDTVFVPKEGRSVSLREAFLLGDDPEDPGDTTRVGVERSAEEGVNLSFRALVGRTYQLEQSEDLVDWTHFESPVTVDEDGELTFPVDTESTDKSFFRLRISAP